MAWPLILIVAGILAACQSVETVLGGREEVSLAEPLWEYARITPTGNDPSRAEPVANRSAGGGRLRVQGLEFDEGVGLHGSSVLTYAPGGRATRLELLAGIDDATSDPEGDARLTIKADGRNVKDMVLRAGDEAQHVVVMLEGVQQLALATEAPKGVYTDLAVTRLDGLPGLRDVLRRARLAYQDELQGYDDSVALPARLPHGPVVFEYRHTVYGTCIGISNANAMIGFAPMGGAIVDWRPAGAGAGLYTSVTADLEPQSRRIDPAPSPARVPWRWRIDRDGTVRLLSPPDPVHGVRWSRTLYLVPRDPVAVTTLMLKNVSGYEASWSAGSRFDCVPGAEVELHADTRSFSVTAGGMSAHVAHAVPASGYFPYGGRAVVVEAQGVAPRVTTVTEVTMLQPGEYIGSEQYWAVLADTGARAVETATAAIAAARTRGPSTTAIGTPTGRTLDSNEKK